MRYFRPPFDGSNSLFASLLELEAYPGRLFDSFGPKSVECRSFCPLAGDRSASFQLFSVKLVLLRVCFRDC